MPGTRGEWCYRCAEVFYMGVQAVADGEILAKPGVGWADAKRAGAEELALFKGSNADLGTYRCSRCNLDKPLGEIHACI